MKASDPFPIVYVKDVAKSEQFYCDAFAFEAVYRFPADGPSDFVYLQLEPLASASEPQTARTCTDGRSPRGQDRSSSSSTSTTWTRPARDWAPGAPELRPPVDEPWGERRAYFEDPDGNAIHVAVKL